MDIFEELESMAVNAADDCDVESEPSEAEIQRWQTLFAYSYSEAVEQIKNQKSDYSRYRVSNDHWDLVRSQKEAQGYSRDAYEHWIKTRCQSALSSHGAPKHIDISSSSSQAHSSYLILLEGILSTPKSIQDAANLSETPPTVQAASETRAAVFCKIDGTTKQSIQSWLLQQQNSAFKPTFVRLSKAKKDLDPNSRYPTLGLESTLPQHRYSPDPTCDTTLSQQQSPAPSTLRTSSYPVHQDTYPIHYFFYGTLASPAFLTTLLSLPESESPPLLIPASITGGVIKTTRNGKYKTLINGNPTDIVQGYAYEVTTREREDALLVYETERYEVVRCGIRLMGIGMGIGMGMVQGVTFRFVGGL